MKSARMRLALFSLSGLVGAVLAGALASSIVFADSAPALALALWPGNGEARTRMSDAMIRPVIAAELGNQPFSPAQRESAVAAARRGLREQPLNPAAVRVIALGGDYSDRERYAMLAAGNRLSRRDTLTQIWLIRKSALASNLPEVMTHYDALLRRDSAARDAAARVLARAMADPKVADAAAGLLKQDPDWKSLLYHYLLRQPESWDAFVGLHRQLAGTKLIPVETSVDFAGRLIDAGHIDDANRITMLIGQRPLKRSASVADTTFATRPALPGRWSETDAAMASLQPLAHDGALLNGGSGARGVVARRLIALRPGRYSAVIAYGQSDSLPPRLLEARIACAGGLPKEAGNATLTVTAACPYQWLSIYLPEPLTSEQEIHLKNVRVSPDD